MGQKENQKNYRLKNKDYLYKQTKEWKEKNKAKVQFYSAKQYIYRKELLRLGKIDLN